MAEEEAEHGEDGGLAWGGVLEDEGEGHFDLAALEGGDLDVGLVVSWRREAHVELFASLFSCG